MSISSSLVGCRLPHADRVRHALHVLAIGDYPAILDLADKFLEDYKAGDSRQAVVKYGHYFLGSIILSSKEGAEFIVDGQQRLTTKPKRQEAAGHLHILHGQAMIAPLLIQGKSAHHSGR